MAIHWRAVKNSLRGTTLIVSLFQCFFRFRLSIGEHSELSAIGIILVCFDTEGDKNGEGDGDGEKCIHELKIGISAPIIWHNAAPCVNSQCGPNLQRFFSWSYSDSTHFFCSPQIAYLFRATRCTKKQCELKERKNNFEPVSAFCLLKEKLLNDLTTSKLKDKRTLIATVRSHNPTYHIVPLHL